MFTQKPFNLQSYTLFLNFPNITEQFSKKQGEHAYLLLHKTQKKRRASAFSILSLVQLYYSVIPNS